LLEGGSDALSLKRSDKECEFTLTPFAAEEYGSLVASLSGGYTQHLHFAEVLGLFGMNCSPWDEKGDAKDAGREDRKREYDGISQIIHSGSERDSTHLGG
jgi:hypothetical protein